jgi:hypothetical protein
MVEAAMTGLADQADSPGGARVLHRNRRAARNILCAFHTIKRKRKSLGSCQGIDYAPHIPLNGLLWQRS